MKCPKCGYGEELQRISDACLQLVKHFEGCHLKSYRCPANVLTIGYGHTGPDVKEEMSITQGQADELLKLDMERFENAVRSCVKVPIDQGQFDALVSFAFNCGAQALKASTLLKKLNAVDVIGAAQEFHRWNKGGGKVLKGLVRRRAAEAHLFATGELKFNF